MQDKSYDIGSLDLSDTDQLGVAFFDAVRERCSRFL